MTRPVDAEALNKFFDVCGHKTWTSEEIKNIINIAPTVQADGDLISKRAAIDVIEKDVENLDKKLILFTLAPEQYADNFKLCVESRIDGLNDALIDIESLPSAPDSRQRGEWVRNDKIGTFKIFTCDKCGCNMDTDAWDFCPNCGAYMREGDNNGNGI